MRLRLYHGKNAEGSTGGTLPAFPRRGPGGIAEKNGPSEKLEDFPEAPPPADNV